MLQFLFEVFAKPKILNLDDLGFETITHDFFKDPELVMLGLVQPDYRKSENGYLKTFKRQHPNEIIEYLFVNREKIIQTLFMEGFIVYRKDYVSEKNTVFEQYLPILNLMPKFNHLVAQYQEHKMEELLPVAQYIHSQMEGRTFDHYDVSCFEVKRDKSLESVYKITDKENVIQNVKVIGSTVYVRDETYIEQLNFENTGVRFLPLKACWLSDSTRNAPQKASVLELSFNNKSFFYIKAKLSTDEDDDYNIVIFENVTQADMSNISFDKLVRSGSNFQKTILMKDARMTSDFLMYTRIKNVLQNYPEALSWYLNILCKECVSEETRKEFGFKLEGDLEGDELLMIEALVI